MSTQAKKPARKENVHDANFHVMFVSGIRGQCSCGKDAKSLRRKFANVPKGNLFLPRAGWRLDNARPHLGVCILETKTAETQDYR